MPERDAMPRLRAAHEQLMRQWAALAADEWRGIRLFGLFALSYGFGSLTVMGMRDPGVLGWALGLFVAGVYFGIALVQWRWQRTLDGQREFFERAGNEVFRRAGTEVPREGQGDG